MSAEQMTPAFVDPAAWIAVHVLNRPPDYALPAGGHLQLPASYLPGIEDRHPAHHEVVGAS